MLGSPTSLTPVPHVLAVHRGRRRLLDGVRRSTGIDKRAVSRVEVRDPGPRQGGLGSGVVGDEIGNSRHHGGDAQAVYAFAREELDRWARELDREIPSGMFGENLTTTGIDVDGALVGERWRVGTSLLEVTGPRIPCGTFAVRMQEPRWVRRFTAHGRSGTYFAVLEAGVIEPGDPIEVEHRPDDSFTVTDLFRACTGDRAMAERIGAWSERWPADHDWLAARRQGARA